MPLRPTLNFLLHDWLQIESLTQRPRFSEHSSETFAAVLDTCERIAREKYAPFNRLMDTAEPFFDGEKVVLPQAAHDAHKAYAASGMLGAAQDEAIGGMQLPYTVEAAANTFFALASIGIGSVGTSELPVFPTTFSISGNFSNSIFAPCEIAVIEVCKLLPGKTRVSTAKSPSSNDGINSPPINESVMIAKTNNVSVVPIITLGIANAFSKIG